ncbi:MAG: D-alanyl-D-alanine carboxypeptidase [Ruminococcus sp.]|nr:D-alanyl-D-alanine carboxypeptidase [Ruminococcus sp.]
MFKKSISFITAVILSFLTAVHTGAVLFQPNFTITSEAAVLVNLDKDVTVYEKNPTKKMYPASLTKLVNAMVVLDNVKDFDNTIFYSPVAVFDELYGQGASSVGLAHGEEVTLRDLMYSMLMLSACESAGILAWNVGGESIPNFIAMMNEKADSIGCTGTNFVNSHGLFDPNQYTNARDMALICQYAYDNYPKLIEIATTREYTMGATNYHEAGWKTIKHTNKMLDPNSEYYYSNAKGLKTGTLDESGRCLASLGSRDGNNYLLVTLGSPLYDREGNADFSVYTDHKDIYEWAFNTFSYQKLLSTDREITEIEVEFGKNDHVLLVPADEYMSLWPTNMDSSTLKEDINLTYVPESGIVPAPIKAGDVYGSYTLSHSGEVLVTVPLVAKNSVERDELSFLTDKASKFPQSRWFIAAIVIASGLTVIYTAIFITVVVVRNKKQRNNSRLFKK